MFELKNIEVCGVCEYNLKNIDVDILCDQFVVIIGLLGLGKFLLVFDMIYVEGQCCYVESLSVYVWQFFDMMEKLDVDYIVGFSFVILIEQKMMFKNLCLMVGIVIEVYDYLCFLFVCVGMFYSFVIGLLIEVQQVQDMVDCVMVMDEGICGYLLVLIVCDCKGEYCKEMLELCKQGFQWVKVDGEFYELDELFILDKKFCYDIDVVVDCIVVCEGLEICLVDSF